LIVSGFVFAANVDRITQWVFSDVAPSITLLNPSDDSVLGVNTTLFNWSSVDPEGESVYHVWYADIDSGFGSPLRRMVDVGYGVNVTPDVFPDGDWYWRVEGTDGVNINTSETWHFEVRTNVSNHFPVLSSGSCLPLVGNQMTIFLYRVKFTDLDNDTASFVNVSINGVQYGMSESNVSDMDTSDGKWYKFLTTLSPGTYNYSFVAGDGVAVNWTSLVEGVPVVSYSVPHAPVQSDAVPFDGEEYVGIPPANVSVSVSDIDGQLMDVYFYRYDAGSWVLFDNVSDVGNGSVVSSNTSWISDFGVTYRWSVNVTDGEYWTNVSRNFTTDTLRVVAVYPLNDDLVGVQPVLVFSLLNPTGRSMNYSVFVGDSLGNCSTLLANGSGVANGSYSGGLYWLAVNASESYYWRVAVDDGVLFVNESFVFNVSSGGVGSGLIVMKDMFALVVAMAGLGFGVMSLGIVLWLVGLRSGDRQRKKKKSNLKK